MTSYPKGYEWLSRVGTLPRIVAAGLADIGLRETPGAANNPVIMGWAAQAGVAGSYRSDSTPWCGLGMAHWAIEAGKVPPKAPLWALNWALFGTRVAGMMMMRGKSVLTFEPGKAASLGDVLVFKRPVIVAGKPGWAGHVGEYIAQDDDAYHVLGANQGDAVSIVRIARDRCVAVRRPAFASAMPASAKPYHVAATGALSTRET